MAPATAISRYGRACPGRARRDFAASYPGRPQRSGAGARLKPGHDALGRRFVIALLSALLVWFAIVATPARAEPDYPAFTGLVVDDAHVLSDADKAALTAKLRALQDKTGIQFAVATVDSLGGDEIEPYANALFRKWKIGQKDVNNGLLLILAPKERKLRFEVGYGLEGTFTDVQSKLILHNTMVPKLKAGDPAGALKGGVDDAIAVLTKAGQADGTLQETPAASTGDNSVGGLALALFLLIPLIVILIFVIVIIQTLRGKIHWTSGPGGWSTGSSTGSSWSSSDSSSSSSGGDSFSGGGGGDSGGGGASDSY